MTDELIVRDSTFDNYPPGWARWSDLVKRRHRPKDLGLECGFVDLNRFAHRYRLAKSFRGISLEQYTPSTTDGYSGLFSVFLVWSAFEQYLKIAKWRQSDCMSHFSCYEVAEPIAAVRAQDPQYRFYSMIAGKSHTDVRRQLELFMAGDGCNFTYLASSVRHIFAHGFLTPGANKSRPAAVAEICRLVAAMHFRVLECEFACRVMNLSDGGCVGDGHADAVDGRRTGAEAVPDRRVG